jgi:hypothetical protein
MIDHGCVNFQLYYLMGGKMENYYAWNEEHKVHLSVGAVLVNEEGKLLVMYLARTDAKYFFPTKTHELGRSLEASLDLIPEKIGLNFTINKFIGTTQGEFLVPGDERVMKTTLWYLCTPGDEVVRDPEQRDIDAELRWMSSEELDPIFAEQANISSDYDQRPVLEMLEA